MSGLEPVAVVFMALSILTVTALTAYCLYRVLTKPRRRSPPESDPPRP